MRGMLSNCAYHLAFENLLHFPSEPVLKCRPKCLRNGPRKFLELLTRAKERMTGRLVWKTRCAREQLRSLDAYVRALSLCKSESTASKCNFSGWTDVSRLLNEWKCCKG